MIVGGWNASEKKMSNEIYYCMSNDINNKNSENDYSIEQRIWQLSLIKLPFALNRCQCIITDQKSKNPKLIILGGYNEYREMTDECFEYNLCDIVGYDTFNRFITFDYETVENILFYFCFVLIC